MSARVVLVAVAAGVLGVAAGWWWQGAGLRRPATEAPSPAPATPTVPMAAVGEAMPALVLPDPHGKSVDLAQLAGGRPLLINAWASWCAPCVKEMPELDRFAAAQGARGVQVVGLALDSAQNVQQFLQRVPVRYALVLDTPGPADASVRLGDRAGVLPYSVLVGADGRILRQKVGPFADGEIERWIGAAAPAAAQIQTRD
ncbi:MULTISPECIES: TlpA disulfide reductase family protein [Pseudoxanthomonas]|uniref:Thiol-disulfide isomerase/thioredoxin n=1 Tax=Pseudoxanthomonas winnipegensis TaxID=2480810 RepID=A0AAW8G7D8_9GAMM|nr:MULTISPECIES: TlpA disulfide reductase family protein [Pseudoxanthomonas]MDQ1117882.1 thiol-disulfide isomerase/thioredoxin [Pseudoxanthomonas winnipegensis]MDQ1134853.1 thiol-disulfide isomerase/thioredoxin [Pseudoxanthomonas winnipegensis]MDR6138914.1 thiol-disulfide isomerase/thioredoxin [Pseudoxanthomonas sp. SORGH_AS_0997]